MISPYAKQGYIDHQTLSFDAYAKFIEDDFLDGQRLNPKTDGRPDPRPDVREDEPELGDLQNDFNFNQIPAAPGDPASDAGHRPDRAWAHRRARCAGALVEPSRREGAQAVRARGGGEVPADDAGRAPQAARDEDALADRPRAWPDRGGGPPGGAGRRPDGAAKTLR